MSWPPGVRFGGLVGAAGVVTEKNQKMKAGEEQKSRRIICGLLAAVMAAACAAPAGPAGPAPEHDPDWEKVERCTKRAVEYLLSQQQSNGAIVDNNRHHTTMTALAIMAMLAVGHKPADQTKHGQAMKKALDFVLAPDRQDERGYFGKKDGARMYGHGIVTLMLAEALGMGADDEQDRAIRRRLEKAVQLILRAQAVQKDKRNEGGWRYNPDSTDSDLSVVAWQLIALRAAKGAGIEIPKEAIDKAVEYVRRCYRRQGPDKGFFCYQPGDGSMRFGSAAGGFLAMQICGHYDAPEVAGAANYFLDCDIAGLRNREHFYYGLYYYSQGMFQRRGKYAEKARRVVQQVLLETQNEDGSWPPGPRDQEGGKVYVTSLAMLSLSIYYHYLPIYQR